MKYRKDISVKQITFKKLSDIRKGTKSLSVHHKNEDQNAITDVRKTFLYLVTQEEAMEPNHQPPQIYIRKCFDSKTHNERFCFRVKGSFYMTYSRLLLKVRFHHTLKILVINKILSPKKSAVLT